MEKRWVEFLSGARAATPILVGVIPFGMIYGVLAVEAGLFPPEAQAMSAIIFAGSSQFIAVQLINNTAAGIVIVFTVAVVNLRHMLYSASIAPYFQQLKMRWKLFLSYFLTDEAYLLSITEFDRRISESEKNINPFDSSSIQDITRHQHWYFLGAGLALWIFWQLSTAIGIFLGAVIPTSWSLEFTLPLTLIALLIPSLKDRSTFITAIVAGTISLIAVSMPYKLGLVASALSGILAGLLVETRS